MDKHVGIYQLKELITGILDVGVAMVEEFSDGIQLRDVWAIATKLQSSPRYREAIGKAYEGTNKVPGEMSDLNGDEAIELVMLVLPYLPRLVKAARPKLK